MADTLDSMLEPGEQVLWRDPRAVKAGVVWFLTVGMPLLAGGTALSLVETGSEDWLICAIVLALWLAMAVPFTFIFFAIPKDTRITDRRVLLSRSDPDDDSEAVTAIPVGEIISLELADSGLGLIVKLQRRDGETLALGDLHRGQDFATALAQAADLPAPPSVGRLERLGMVCFAGGGTLLTLVLFALDLWFIVAFGGGFGTFSTFFASWGTVAAGFVLGTHLTGLLAFVLMPHFASAEEARAWLNLEREETGWPMLTHWFGWKHPLYAKLASWVYGEPMNGLNAEAAGHG